MDLKNKQIGAYRLISPIGKGGMAEVWLANQLTLNREVAIKIIEDTTDADDERQMSARFAREAQAIAHLDHPGILPVIDYGNAEGYLYLVMPYVRGGSLQDRLRRETLSRGEAFDVFARILGGLKAAHQKNIIHRDLKPANILLYPDGRAVIADFGVAKTLTQNVSLTQTGVAVGSPEFMAPEQFKGQVDYRSDLYAMGVILYQLLTGHALYSGTTSWEIAMRHMTEPLPFPNSLVPVKLENFLIKALSKNPDGRFANAAEMEAAFHRVASSLSPEELQFRPPKANPTRRFPNPDASLADFATTPLGMTSPIQPPTSTASLSGLQQTYLLQPSPAQSSADLKVENISGNNFSQSAPISNSAQQPTTPLPSVITKKKNSPILLIAGAIGTLLLAVVAVVLIMVLGVPKTQATPTVVAANNTVGAIVSPATNAATLKVLLNAQNGSNVSGSSVITDNGDGSVTVILTASGLTPGVHAAHIHSGTCLAQGPIQFPLTNLQAGSDGKTSSTTRVAADFATMTAGNLYFNIHNESGTPTYVASCGEIAT